LNKRWADVANRNTFFKQDWKKKSDTELRKWVYKKFQEHVDNWSFNNRIDSDHELPILPAIHGTQVEIAMSIAKTGFASLSQLDAGYFGKGIYFTSSALYALPYTSFGISPCFVIALLIPGNVYPVIEHHKDKDVSLLGSAIRAGYQTHYVCTQKNGNCCITNQEDCFNEIVVEQESSITPIYIIQLELEKTKKNCTRVEQRYTYYRIRYRK